VPDIELPLLPARLAEAVRGAEMAAPSGTAKPRDTRHGDRRLSGEGGAKIAASPQQVWAMLLDPATLAAVIPGCHGVKKLSDTDFTAVVTIGVGPVKGRYRARIMLSDLDKPAGVTLAGNIDGALGFGSGKGRITLAPETDGGTSVHYRYDAEIGGKVASIGGRLLDGAARFIIGQFFAGLARQAGDDTRADDGVIASALSKLRGLFGSRR
jgi:2-furoyl-CoA dehydrogenase large subunit